MTTTPEVTAIRTRKGSKYFVQIAVDGVNLPGSPEGGKRAERATAVCVALWARWADRGPSVELRTDANAAAALARSYTNPNRTFRGSVCDPATWAVSVLVTEAAV